MNPINLIPLQVRGYLGNELGDACYDLPLRLGCPQNN